MKKVLFIFGTRPEAIKLAPLVNYLENTLHTVVINTGQHRDMVKPVLELFGVQEDEDLNIMKERQSLHELTVALLPLLHEVLERYKPDAVVVQGDTTSSYLGALSAFYKKIPLYHVEAGLRSFDMYEPFPEEMNRRQISGIASHHFAPTSLNKQNLLNEGIKENNITVSGNTVIDALSKVKSDYKPATAYQDLIPESAAKKGILTTHRRENIGEPLLNILRAVKRVLEFDKDLHLLFPLHPNPRIKEIIDDFGVIHPRLTLTQAVPYLDFVHMLDMADIVLTDSGGIQEEAAALGKPVLVLRNNTERQELIEEGIAFLCGTDPDDIYNDYIKIYNKGSVITKSTSVYGEGKSASIIGDIIIDQL